MLLVVTPGAPSSFLLLVAMPGAPSSFLLLVAMPLLPMSSRIRRSDCPRRIRRRWSRRRRHLAGTPDVVTARSSLGNKSRSNGGARTARAARWSKCFNEAIGFLQSLGIIWNSYKKLIMLVVWPTDIKKDSPTRKTYGDLKASFATIHITYV